MHDSGHHPSEGQPTAGRLADSQHASTVTDDHNETLHQRKLSMLAGEPGGRQA